MMSIKILRRLLLLAALVGFAVCVVLLLNFTAPNPTGRRYSSGMPLTTGQDSNAIGDSGEDILARDLRLPNNNDSGRQCFCSNPNEALSSGLCYVCVSIVRVTSPGGYRIPDFIGTNFIAESKNAQGLPYSSRDRQEVSDYAIAARAMGYPLWIYVRVNTTLSDDFYRIAESTGGGIVKYFTVPGWVDPVDDEARIGLVVFGAVIGLVLAWEVLALKLRRSNARFVTISDPPPPSNAGHKTPPKLPHKAIDHAEGFFAQTKDRAGREQDIEDSRGF